MNCYSLRHCSTGFPQNVETLCKQFHLTQIQTKIVKLAQNFIAKTKKGGILLRLHWAVRTIKSLKPTKDETTAAARQFSQVKERS